MKQIAVLAYPGCWAMGLHSVVDFFRIVALLEQHLGLEAAYQLRVYSVDGQAVTGAAGYAIAVDGALVGSPAADILVVPPLEGTYLRDGFSPAEQSLNWLRDGHRRGARILAMTTGVSLLAAAGLANSPLASHWAWLRQLKTLFPHSQFNAHSSCRQEDGIWSTGTLNGGFDALLEILAQDRGDPFSQLCAAHLLVTSPQGLNPILPGHRNHSDAVILQLQEWLENHYASGPDITSMAVQAGLAVRTLKRRFTKATGISPNLYVQKVRIDKAKKLLLSSSLSVQQIGWQVGYENTSFFVRLFKQHTGKTPGQWRTSLQQ